MGNLYAQETRVDSLLNLLKTAKEKVRLNVLNELTPEILDRKDAEVYAKEALNLAKQFNAEEAEVDALDNMGMDAYSKYKEMLKADDPMQNLVDNAIAACKSAPNFTQNPEMVKMVNLGKKLNNEFSNFNAVLSGDGKTIAYTTQTKVGFDVYVASYIGDSISVPQKITRQLGGDFLKTSSLSYDGKDLYLVSVDPENADIYVSSLAGSKWQQAVKLPKPINSKGNETHENPNPSLPVEKGEVHLRIQP